MFIIIGIMLSGMLLGFLIRNKRLTWIHKVITSLIWLLLFLLGIDVGSNETIIKGLYSIGFEALIITLGAVVGSTLLAWALWYFINEPLTKKVRDER
ncbi:MAG: lysine exporter LysO family protein [Bacteroides sp.]|nr:lysine exporter LysO family protein [Bacteroides sp.]